MMLSTALDMEEKGMAYYEKALKTAENKLGRDIFAGLKEDEGKHMERIKKIYSSIKGKRCSPGSGKISTWTRRTLSPYLVI